MKDRKLSGSFYTPKVVSDFVVEYIFEQLDNKHGVKVLEPSAGDGVFIKSLLENDKIYSQVKKIVAIEKSKVELNKISHTKKDRLEKRHADFLSFQRNSRRKFDIVIGNPPYIKKNHLKEYQIKLCKEIHQEARLLNHEPRNIWTAFLVRCIEFTNPTGIIAFILPSEILQVKFAEELRKLLHEKFDRVEYLNFHELIFEAEGQNTVLVVAYRKSNNPGVYFGTINKLEDLRQRNFTLNKNDIIQTVSTKEIHHNISSDDLNFLNNLRKRLNKISFYTTSKPGIVTAANEYFIVNKANRRKYALAKFTKPIIQRGAFVNGKVEFNKADWDNLSKKELPCYLLDFNNAVVSREDSKLKSYLRLGKQMEIDIRYKCQERERWYKVPNITSPAEALFFKRCHHYPKLLKNGANAYVTDSAYMVNAIQGYSIDSITYSFYNSLTLLFAELEGRYYGGGVLELTPSEFKNLPIPYLGIDSRTFKSFSKDFAKKSDITAILDRNDPTILNQILGLDALDIERLKRIHLNLLLTRLKKSQL